MLVGVVLAAAARGGPAARRAGRPAAARGGRLVDGEILLFDRRASHLRWGAGRRGWRARAEGGDAARCAQRWATRLRDGREFDKREFTANDEKGVPRALPSLADAEMIKTKVRVGSIPAPAD